MFVVPSLTNSIRLLADFLRYLDKSFEITLFVIDNDVRFDAEFPPEARRIICNAGMSKAHLPRTFWKLYRAARQQDVVVSFAELSPTYLTAVAGRLAGRPVVGWVHAHLTRIFKLGQRPGRLHRPFLKSIYPRLAAVVGVSEGVRDDLRDTYGITDALAIVNGIDIDRVRRLGQEPIPENLKHVYESGEPVIVNVAAQAYQKDPATLVRVHEKLIREGVRHRLLFVGDGPLRKETEAMVRELGLEKTAFFAGYVDNPYPLIRNAAVKVLTSRWEGFALVLAEALALGTPVACTDCESGPREILDNGRYGLLAPVGDVDRLAEAVRTLLEDRVRRDQLVALAPEGAARQSIRPRVDEMEQLLKRLSA